MRILTLAVLSAATTCTAYLNTRQKIACDMCMTEVEDCSTYTPDHDMLNQTRPDPYKLGSLMVCDASEDEYWTTSGRFKVGDDEHQPEEQRVGCPCYDGEDCRRLAVQEGKLDFAQDRICGVLIKKDMPSGESDQKCTQWVAKNVPNSQGRDMDLCSTRFN
mmetsp:Transcript_25673/g.53358  ORF Transcript_25673/g.53358 Transcript_25673/m.53358 type:complete len:161 (+) Transcript_25673:302-784(+)